jgi:hypothetical protein
MVTEVFWRWRKPVDDEKSCKSMRYPTHPAIYSLIHTSQDGRSWIQLLIVSSHYIYHCIHKPLFISLLSHVYYILTIPKVKSWRKSYNNKIHWPLIIFNLFIMLNIGVYLWTDLMLIETQALTLSIVTLSLYKRDGHQLVLVMICSSHRLITKQSQVLKVCLKLVFLDGVILINQLYFFLSYFGSWL